MPRTRPRLLDAAPGRITLRLYNALQLATIAHSFFAMTPAVLEAPTHSAPATATQGTSNARPASPPTDAILSLDQVALLLGESPEETRDLTSLGLLKHQLIDGERCVWLSDLITFKRDFDKAYAAYLASPTSRIDDDEMLNPFDVLPEYKQMLEP